MKRTPRLVGAGSREVEEESVSSLLDKPCPAHRQRIIDPCPSCGKALKRGNVEIDSTPPCHRPYRTQYFECTNRECAVIDVTETDPRILREARLPISAR
jgi:hypothetical protein